MHSSSGSWIAEGDDAIRWTGSITLAADIAEIHNGSDWFSSVFARDMSALLGPSVAPQDITVGGIVAGSVIVDFTIVTAADNYSVYNLTAAGFVALRDAIDAGTARIGLYAATSMTANWPLHHGQRKLKPQPRQCSRNHCFISNQELNGRRQERRKHI